MAGIISITGTGIICAIGNDAPSVLGSLRRKESGIGKMKYLQSVHTDIPVGEVKLSNGQMKEMLGIPADERVSRTSLMGAIAVREALADAACDLSGKKVALISGTTVGVMDISEQDYDSPRGNDCGASTAQIARCSGLEDASCCTICTACSSALNSIMLGAEMLERGEADIVVAGGSEPLSRYHLNGFNTLMILDRERCRPFDATRAGLNLGEGAAFVVLEKDSPRGRVFLHGYANRCDAFHQTATSAGGDGAFFAMSAALNMAGIAPGKIKYINAHGTGTPDNDASESAAVRRVFGTSMPEISSTKSYTGHTTSASGSIETVICVLAMLHGFTPASLGWSNPMEDGIIPTAGSDNAELDYVMCNSFGFGGNDSSMVLGKYPPAASGERPEGPEPVLLAKVTVDSDDALGQLKEFLSPIETRRMGKLMRSSLLAAYLAMREAGIERPDAIVAATSKGMMEYSMQFLSEIRNNGEEYLSPTTFMLSTHNTIASAIAIKTCCHGYNITYSQGDDSLSWALRDARRLISSGEAGKVLVISFDEELDGCRTSAFRSDCFIYSSSNRAPRI